MKQFLIEYNGSYHVQSCRGFKPASAVAEVPKSISREDYPYLKVRNVLDPELQIEVLEVYVDQELKGLKMVEDSKGVETSAIYDSYLSDIEVEMKRIYGTTNQHKANALYNTWQLWLTDPSFFSDKGLKDENGDDLNTASKISIYAQLKLEQSKDYSVFLMTREQQRDSELNQIS